MGNLSKNSNWKRLHDEKSMQRNISHHDWLRAKRRSFEGVPKNERRLKSEMQTLFYDYLKIRVPKVLSLIDNYESVLKFIQELQDAYRNKKKVFVLMNSMESFTGDGLIILLSNVVLFKSANIPFNGDYPKKKDVRERLMRTSFYDALYKFNYANESHYDLTKKDFFTHANKNVDSDLTARLIAHNSYYLWDEERRCTGVQRIFLELMQNTNNHASLKQGEKHWWLHVSKADNPKRLCFSFIDYGMGIFESLANKDVKSKFFRWAEKMLPILNPKDHCVLLQAILNGTFHSTVTNKSYRGKGLPGIFNTFVKHKISRLIIITNDVFSEASCGKFLNINHKLNGTFVYFEVDATCQNLPKAA